MNRRGFLKGFVGAVAGAALAEELSTKSIFLPPRGGWGIPLSLAKLQEEMAIAAQMPTAYLFGTGPDGLERYAAEIPQFLTNYMDPKVIDILVSPMKYQLIRKLT